MPQWKPEDEALFAELCRRAEQQSREAALRAAPAPPPPPLKGAAGAFAPTPPAAAGGGAPRRVPSQTAPLAARRPTLDQETLLILSARGSLFIASFSAAVPFPYRPACHFSYNTNHYIQLV